MRAYEMSLAVGPAGAYAAWHGGRGEGSSIHIQKVTPDGQLSGMAMPVSDGRRLAYEPDLLLAGDRLIVAWYEKDAATGQLTAMMAGLDGNGGLLWRVPLADEAVKTRNPVVRQIGRHLHVAWLQQAATEQGGEAAVWHRRFSLAGVAETRPRRIGSANATSWNLNASVYGASLVVTYDAARGTAAHELHMLVVTDETVRHRQLSADDGHASLYPDIQVNRQGRAALTWFDERDGNREVYLIVAPFEDFLTGHLPPPMRITEDKGESIGAYLAWNGPTLGLVWSDEPGGSREIFVGRFSDDGHPLDVVRQLGTSAGRASIPAIRASGTGFLVAWNDYEATAEGGHMPGTASTARLAWVPGAP